MGKGGSMAEVAANINIEKSSNITAISPHSEELVIGLVGYAGAGCSTVADKISILLSTNGYEVFPIIKVSNLISSRYPDASLPVIPSDGPDKGKTALERSIALQNLGDRFRKEYGSYSTASLIVKEIISKRGKEQAGEKKRAFIIDSLKHQAEVELLRSVYDQSFRLVAVHSERTTRESRLCGNPTSGAKYAGATENKVKEFMERDEKDAQNKHGQQVRDVFYLADYFVDNNEKDTGGIRIVTDLSRFINLLTGAGLVRPTSDEAAMFHAYAAAHKSSCLSRQVGAVLASKDGQILSTGTNDVPMFGGGIYGEGTSPDHRCFQWDWSDGELEFKGCHNDRKKNELKKKITTYLADALSDGLALAAHPKQAGMMDSALEAREVAARKIKEVILASDAVFESTPGVRDLIEFSRAVHAEMNAILNAARQAAIPAGAKLFCTTYPCHSCARHLVAAGINAVYYIEPYTKSLAAELHYDAIQTELPKIKPGTTERETQLRMLILPFTGIGPRLYEEVFCKRVDLKSATGAYKVGANKDGGPEGVRLLDLVEVEKKAAELVPG
jgi:deoxycytidylate deaminase